MAEPLTLYSAAGSGGVAVEAALTLAGRSFDLIEAETFDFDDPVSGDRVLAVNPMRQVPALILPCGETLTESVAILAWIAEAHPKARLAPPPGDPRRGQFLRWMSFVSSAIYALYWVKDDPARLAPDPAAQSPLVERAEERIAECWRIMDSQVEPGRYLLGDEIGVLDVYVATVSRFSPRRARFYAVAPKMAPVVRRVDEEPRLAKLWAARMPSQC
jgi:GST-like protein